MVEVRLHGALARDFGKVWHLDIASPAEAVRAIECGRAGFKRAILELEKMGMVFRVRSKAHDYGDDDVDMLLGETKRIDIIPIVRGASAGVRFVLGAVLVGAALLVPGLQAAFPKAAALMVGAGATLMLGAITEWLTPTPKRERGNENVQSWSLSGPVNTVEQGLPVPVIYGEVLTGGYTISAGLVAAQLSPGQSIAPDIAIGGTTDYNIPTSNLKPNVTAVVVLSVGAFNLDEPYSYVWSFSGFSQATAGRISQINTASVRLELDYYVPYPSTLTDSGTLFITMTGRESTSSQSPTPQFVSINKSQIVTVTVTNLFHGGGWQG